MVCHISHPLLSSSFYNKHFYLHSFSSTVHKHFFCSCSAIIHSFIVFFFYVLLFPLVSPNVRTHFYLFSCSSITLSFIVSYTVHKHFYLCSCSSITLPLTPSYCSQTFLYSFFVFCFPFKASHSVLKMLPTHLCL